MKKILIITADTNDADYIISENEIDDNTEQLVKKVANIIKNKRHYNWTTQDHVNKQTPGPDVLYANFLTQEEIESFDELVPQDEYGFHTIESIKILNIISEESLL